MICAHCGGLVVEDRFRDWTARWHCLKCGHVADSVNEQSLLAHQEQERCLFLTNAEPEYWDEEVHLGSVNQVPNPGRGALRRP